MKPKDTLKVTEKYLAELEKAKRMSVAVGLPQEKIRAVGYDSGVNVATVGVAHEYNGRSWLRMPTEMKRKEISQFIQSEYATVLNGGTTSAALDRVGAFAVAQIKQAFATGGFGQWPQVKPATAKIKAEHGRNDILVFTGLLRNSVTWGVRNVA